MYWGEKLDKIVWVIFVLLPYFKFHKAKDTKTNKTGCLFLFFLFFLVEIETIYMNIIIIPPKNAKVKIRGIQGLFDSIHLIVIVIDEKIRIETTKIRGDILVINNADLRIILFISIIQNLVYVKS